MTQTQKNLSRLLLVLVLGISGCGGPSGPCGAAGQQCCGSWPGNPCSSARLSCQRGTCQSCGSEGGPCCGAGHECNANLFCNSPPGGPSFVCQACGHIGQPACVNNTCLTGVFSGGNCIATTGSGGTMCDGSTQFVIGIRDRLSHCRLAEFAVRANSRGDARICAERAARSAGLQEPEAVDASSWDYYPFTSTSSLNGCDVERMPAYSEEDGEFCARFLFPDRTIARASMCP